MVYPFELILLLRLLSLSAEPLVESTWASSYFHLEWALVSSSREVKNLALRLLLRRLEIELENLWLLNIQGKGQTPTKLKLNRFKARKRCGKSRSVRLWKRTSGSLRESYLLKSNLSLCEKLPLEPSIEVPSSLSLLDSATNERFLSSITSFIPKRKGNPDKVNCELTCKSDDVDASNWTANVDTNDSPQQTILRAQQAIWS